MLLADVTAEGAHHGLLAYLGRYSMHSEHATVGVVDFASNNNVEHSVVFFSARIKRVHGYQVYTLNIELAFSNR